MTRVPPFSSRALNLCVASLLLLWSTHAKAQQNAQTLLAQITRVAAEAHSLSATITLTRQAAGQPLLKTTGTILLLKPNYALIRLTGDDPPRVLASNGHDLFTLAPDDTYTQVSIDRRGTLIAAPWWSFPIRFFFTQSLNPFGPDPDPSAHIQLLPDRKIAGTSLSILQATGSQPMGYTARFFFTSTGTLQRSVVYFGDPESPGATFSAELSNVRPNPPVTPAAFRFTPPANAKRKQGTLTESMLALGDTAPEFTLPTPQGVPTTLASQRQNAKATLINFWYLDCPPCRIEFPGFETLYQQLHAQGLNLVAIDKGDKAADVTRFIQNSGLTFPILLGGENTPNSIFSQYRTSSIFPATYLLDSQGRIVYRSAGADPRGLREALNQLGLH